LAVVGKSRLVDKLDVATKLAQNVFWSDVFVLAVYVVAVLGGVSIAGITVAERFPVKVFVLRFQLQGARNLLFGLSVPVLSSAAILAGSFLVGVFPVFLVSISIAGTFLIYVFLAGGFLVSVFLRGGGSPVPALERAGTL